MWMLEPGQGRLQQLGLCEHALRCFSVTLRPQHSSQSVATAATAAAAVLVLSSTLLLYVGLVHPCSDLECR